MKTYEQLQEDIDNDKNPSIDEVWNAAIEAAALVYTKYTTENPTMVLDNLRSLKK